MQSWRERALMRCANCRWRHRRGSRACFTTTLTPFSLNTGTWADDRLVFARVDRRVHDRRVLLEYYLNKLLRIEQAASSDIFLKYCAVPGI